MPGRVRSSGSGRLDNVIKHHLWNKERKFPFFHVPNVSRRRSSSSPPASRPGRAAHLDVIPLAHMPGTAGERSRHVQAFVL